MMRAWAYTALGLSVVNLAGVIFGKSLQDRIICALSLALYLPLVLRVLGWL